jgi:selenium metabolism protein YedF
MEREVDARGLSCPQPVIQTQKALEAMAEGILRVIVDDLVAKENVQRLAESQGCSVEVKEEGGVYHLKIKKSQTAEGEKKHEAGADEAVFLICTHVLGKGYRKLGETLMDAFVHTLVDAAPRPGKIILVNDGVKLATEGSAVLEALEVLEERGVEISSCGTCLNFYEIKDKLKVGRVTNMFEIIGSLNNARKVISI